MTNKKTGIAGWLSKHFRKGGKVDAVENPFEGYGLLIIETDELETGIKEDMPEPHIAEPEPEWQDWMAYHQIIHANRQMSRCLQWLEAKEMMANLEPELMAEIGSRKKITEYALSLRQSREKLKND